MAGAAKNTAVPIPAVVKSKKWLLLLLLPLAALVVFVVLNITDYRRYRYIMELDKHLTPSDFEAMVQAVMLGDGVYLKDYTDSEIPDVFKKIGAKSVRIYRYRRPNGGGYQVTARLYERGKVDGEWPGFYTYAELYMKITKRNGTISLADNFKGRPKFRTIWTSNPAFLKERNPENRILTLDVYAYRPGGGAQTWIVAEDEIIFCSDEEIERRPITPRQSEAIREAINAIPQHSRGKMFVDTNVMDGAQMEIHFSPDGNASPDDIGMSNSWCADLEPLLKLLRECAPHGDEIITKERMVPSNRYMGSIDEYIGELQIKSIEESRACPPLETDWWITWPKLLLEKPAVVLEVPPELRK